MTIASELLDCMDSVAILTINTPDTVEYAWYSGMQLISDSAILEVNQPGSYVGEVTLENGCATRDTVVVSMTVCV
jgi:hypothetical protein